MARSSIKAAGESDVTPPADHEEILDFDDDTLRGGEKRFIDQYSLYLNVTFFPPNNLVDT